MSLGEYDFGNLERCIEQAKRDIDNGTFDEHAEGVYLGLSAYDGHVDRFVAVIQPYYEKAARR